MLNLEELYQLDRELYKDINLKNSSVAFAERKWRIFEWMKENKVVMLVIHFYFNRSEDTCPTIAFCDAFREDGQQIILDDRNLSGFISHPLTDGRICDANDDVCGTLNWMAETGEITICGQERGWVPFDTIVF